MKPQIDFDAVSPAHRDIDARLRNWARWVSSKGKSWVHPMWRKSVSSSVFGGAESTTGADPLDAQAVEKAVSALPERHRFAVRWCYVYSGSPRRAAQEVGASQEGLYGLIVDGRQMLINRGA